MFGVKFVRLLENSLARRWKIGDFRGIWGSAVEFELGRAWAFDC
jgi:hypothetical protein